MQCGLAPTHLDSHMFSLLMTPELLGVFARVASCFKLPLRLTRKQYHASQCSGLTESLILLDNFHQLDARTNPAEWTDTYEAVARSITPGLNELIVHPGYPSQELDSIMGDTMPWGALWRVRDLRVLTSR